MKPFYDFAQYSDAWFKIRRGMPTASSFDRIITPKKGELAAAHEGYINELIADLFDPYYPRESPFATAAMREGIRREPESRNWLALQLGSELKEVGFVLSDCGRYGCSPDSLAGDDTVVELKNPNPSTHVGWLRQGGLPIEHKVQVHGHLVVTGLPVCVFCSYCPAFPPAPTILIRQEPDWFTDKLRECLTVFLHAYDEAMDRLGLERPCN